MDWRIPAPTLRIPDKEMDRLRGLEDNLLWRSHVQACRAARAGAGLMVPVCDVSGSMSGTPMQVAVALSLLMAESAPADSPWCGKMFTFRTNPKLVDVPGIPEDCDGSTDLEGVSADELAARLCDVGERVGHVQGIEWGGSTEVERVFDLVLQTAVDAGLPSDEVAKMTVVIFSDMEFNAARGRTNVPWETAHEAICATFRDAGYRTPPTLVYWNLRASRSVPVDKGSTPGVQLVSGFSAGMMSSFLAGEDVSPTEHEDVEEGQERQHAEKKTAQEKMMEMLDKRV